MKYKVGDKVKIISELENSSEYYCGFATPMRIFLGKIVTITEKGSISYKIKEDNGVWEWSEDMIERSIEFTKSDLKDNHIVVLRNGTKILYTKNTENHFNEVINNDLTHNYGASLDIVEVWEFDKLVWERKKPVEILDKVEKNWLNHFIKTTNIKVDYIRKCAHGYNGSFLRIKCENHEIIDLPSFKKDAVYKGLESGKRYTLEELGLEI